MKETITVIVISLLICTSAYAYKENTHKKITENAVSKSNLSQYLADRLGFTLLDKFSYDVFPKKTVSDWMEIGSYREDDPPNWVNHFYDFMSHSGLKGFGSPSLSWGKDGLVNTWSWTSARYYFYTALTTTDDFEREKNYAKTFRSVAQVMHLVEDLAVPAHVRNDMHIPWFPSLLKQADLYEKYTEEKASSTSLTYPGYPAIDLSMFNDFDKFWSNNGKGLSEFTGSNFLSRDTNFDSTDYNLPAKPSTTVVLTENVTDVYGIPHTVTVAYLSGNVVDAYRGTTEPIQRLSAFSLFNYETHKKDESKEVYTLNDSVHQEYANFLLPRAAGYAAGLLNYFFRGKIELSLPGSGVYSAAPAGSTFTELRVDAENVSETDEEMPDGSIQLAVKYRLAKSDPFQGVQVEVDPDYYYIVVPEKNGVRTIPRDTTTELVFDLSSTPVPIWAVDVKINVIYKGKLGVETDAVAVGYNDISEPTPIDVFNNADKICIDKKWYDAGLPETIALVDTNHNQIADEKDVYAHDVTNIFYKASSVDDPKLASSSDYTFSSPGLLTGGSARRLGFILTDYNFKLSCIANFVITNPNDFWVSTGFNVMLFDGAGVNNQDHYPAMNLFRGTKLWGGGRFTFVNTLDENAECGWDKLNQ